MTKKKYDQLHHIYDIATHSKFSDRKAYLFGIACIKRIWPFIWDLKLKNAVLELERLVKNNLAIKNNRVSRTVTLQQEEVIDAVDSLFTLSEFGRVYYVFAVSQAVRRVIGHDEFLKEHDWQVKTLKHMVKFDENS
jgi:hypothetical protein